MTSIFRTATGADFDRLHPELQRRFSVGPASGRACSGRGVMDRIRHGGKLVGPFPGPGGTRRVLVPRQGRNIPSTIEVRGVRPGLWPVREEARA